MDLVELKDRFEAMLQDTLDETNYNAAAAVRAGLDKIRQDIRELAAEVGKRKKASEAGACESPNKPFTRAQLDFIVWTVFAGAMDRVQAALPPAAFEEDWSSREERSAYIDGCLATADAVLPILWAQLNNDGMDIGGFHGAERWRAAVDAYVQALIDLRRDQLPQTEVADLERSLFPKLKELALRLTRCDYLEYLRTAQAQGTQSGRFSSKKPNESNTGKTTEVDERRLEPTDGSLTSAAQQTAESSLLFPFELVLRSLDALLLDHGKRIEAEGYRPEYEHGVIGGIRDSRDQLRRIWLAWAGAGGDMNVFTEVIQKLRADMVPRPPQEST
jgi:hypothetical protein